MKSALPSSPEARLLIVVDHWDEAAFACLSPTSPAALLPLGSIPPLQRPAARALLEERGIETIAVHEVADRALTAVRTFYPRFADEIVRQRSPEHGSVLEALDLVDGFLGDLVFEVAVFPPRDHAVEIASGTFTLRLNGKKQVMYPVAPGFVAGALLGIMLRIRAFLYLGASFTLMALISMVWHAARAIEHDTHELAHGGGGDAGLLAKHSERAHQVHVIKGEDAKPTRRLLLLRRRA